jgi:hypothetical protein
VHHYERFDMHYMLRIHRLGKQGLQQMQLLPMIARYLEGP